MEVIGDGSITLYEAHDECPHTPETNPLWQESVVLYMWDAEQGVYAFFRIGHEPNRRETNNPQGLTALWANIWVPGRYFKLYDTLPLQASDRTNTAVHAGDICSYDFQNGKHHWQLQHGNVTANLTMTDDHQGFCFWPDTAGALSDDVAKNHIEAAGCVSGTIEFEGKTFEIHKAVGYRDRSWGPRNWSIMRGHRWVPASFGDDLSVQAVSWMDAEGKIAEFAYIIRDDKIHLPTNIDLVTYSENDGVTNRGGKLVLTMANGEIIECEYHPVAPGAVAFHHGYPCVDTMCKVDFTSSLTGKRTGVGCFEAAYNTLGGKLRPNHDSLVMGKIDNGIFDV
jgi:hypothetical protein